MPRIQHDPSDQVSAAAGACGGTCGPTVVTDEAFGLVGISGRNVTLHVVCDTDADCTSDPFTSASAGSSIWYSTNGGSGWTEIVSKRSSAGCSGPGGDSDSETKGSTTVTVGLGNIADLNQIQVRTEVTTTSTVGGESNGSSDITNWWITADYVFIIGE